MKAKASSKAKNALGFKEVDYSKDIEIGARIDIPGTHWADMPLGYQRKDYGIPKGVASGGVTNLRTIRNPSPITKNLRTSSEVLWVQSSA